MAGRPLDVHRDAKLRKLNTFRRNLPHVSANALASVLDEIERVGLPELRSAKELKESRDAIVNAMTPYGPILGVVDAIGNNGQNIPVLLVNPIALLHQAFSNGGGFTYMIITKLRRHPCTRERPWHVILYSDEVVPGNALANENLRKVWVIMFFFYFFLSL